MGRGYMALHETVAFDNAIAKGLELTKEEETLTIVMADHSHPFTFNGYPFRGQSILGKCDLLCKALTLTFVTCDNVAHPLSHITKGFTPFEVKISPSM